MKKLLIGLAIIAVLISLVFLSKKDSSKVIQTKQQPKLESHKKEKFKQKYIKKQKEKLQLFQKKNKEYSQSKTPDELKKEFVEKQKQEAIIKERNERESPDFILDDVKKQKKFFSLKTPAEIKEIEGVIPRKQESSTSHNHRKYIQKMKSLKKKSLYPKDVLR